MGFATRIRVREELIVAVSEIVVLDLWNAIADGPVPLDLEKAARDLKLGLVHCVEFGLWRRACQVNDGWLSG